MTDDRDFWVTGFKAEDFYTCNPLDLVQRAKNAMLTPDQAREIANDILKRELEKAPIVEAFYSTNHAVDLWGEPPHIGGYKQARLVAIEPIRAPKEKG